MERRKKKRKTERKKENRTLHKWVINEEKKNKALEYKSKISGSRMSTGWPKLASSITFVVSRKM